VTAPRPASAR